MHAASSLASSLALPTNCYSAFINNKAHRELKEEGHVLQVGGCRSGHMAQLLELGRRVCARQHRDGVGALFSLGFRDATATIAIATTCDHGGTGREQRPRAQEGVA